MLHIITPCSRQSNLPRLFQTIDFARIDKWIIVYDTSNDRQYEKLYTSHCQISEVECAGGISGNPQRNHALDMVDDTWVYFLDDDNVIHPNFWSVIDRLDIHKFYTFDQQRNTHGKVLRGNNIAVRHIDTAMFIVHTSHIRDTRWICDKYDADGHFICDINRNNEGAQCYLDIVASYYNYLA